MKRFQRKIEEGLRSQLVSRPSSCTSHYGKLQPGCRMRHGPRMYVSTRIREETAASGALSLFSNDRKSCAWVSASRAYVSSACTGTKGRYPLDQCGYDSVCQISSGENASTPGENANTVVRLAPMHCHGRQESIGADQEPAILIPPRPGSRPREAFVNAGLLNLVRSAPLEKTEGGMQRSSGGQ